MKKMVFIDFEYAEDVAELQKQLLRRGYDVDAASVFGAWQKHSDSMCAGWLCLGSEEGNIANILTYLTDERIINGDS